MVIVSRSAASSSAYTSAFHPEGVATPAGRSFSVAAGSGATFGFATLYDAHRAATRLRMWSGT